MHHYITQLHQNRKLVKEHNLDEQGTPADVGVPVNPKNPFKKPAKKKQADKKQQDDGDDDDDDGDSKIQTIKKLSPSAPPEEPETTKPEKEIPFEPKKLR